MIRNDGRVIGNIVHNSDCDQVTQTRQHSGDETQAMSGLSI